MNSSPKIESLKKAYGLLVDADRILHGKLSVNAQISDCLSEVALLIVKELKPKAIDDVRALEDPLWQEVALADILIERYEKQQQKIHGKDYCLDWYAMELMEPDKLASVLSDKSIQTVEQVLNHLELLAAPEAITQ